jgi:hypothetical protein
MSPLQPLLRQACVPSKMQPNRARRCDATRRQASLGEIWSVSSVRLSRKAAPENPTTERLRLRLDVDAFRLTSSSGHTIMYCSSSRAACLRGATDPGDDGWRISSVCRLADASAVETARRAKNGRDGTRRRTSFSCLSSRRGWFRPSGIRRSRPGRRGYLLFFLFFLKESVRERCH